MKKLLFAIAVVGLFVTSCSDDKKENKDGDKDKTQVEQPKENPEELMKEYEDEFNTAVDEAKGDIELTDTTEVY